MGGQESTERARTRINRSYDREVKLVVAGCSSTTMPDCLINYFLGFAYEPTPACNVAYAFVSHRLIIDEKKVNVQIWDSSMCVRYRSLPPSYLRGRHVGLMILYDVRDESSFQRAKEITIAPHSTKVDPEMPIVLVGCQCQQKERRQVSYHTAREFADERDVPVVEVCGKEGVNVELAFMTLVGELLSRNRFIDLETAQY